MPFTIKYWSVLNSEWNAFDPIFYPVESSTPKPKLFVCTILIIYFEVIWLFYMVCKMRSKFITRYVVMLSREK